MPATRCLKPGPRPLIVFGIILGLLLLLPISIGITRGLWKEAAKIAGVQIGVFAVVGVSIGSVRIIVSGDSIAFRRGVGPLKRVLFRNISRSVPQVLLERDWPVSLKIYCGEDDQPVLSLPLKPFHHSDVTWLLSIPELKVQRR
jgi:hypothetical protein